VHGQAGLLALVAAFSGTVIAYAMYCARLIRPEEIRRQFPSVYDFVMDKWRFDGLYDVIFVHPVHIVSSWCAAFDKQILDPILHCSAKMTQAVAFWDRKFDEGMIDGFVNFVGKATRSVGMSLRVVQTGHLRQYVMWIAVGVVVLFAVLFTSVPK